MLKAIRKQVISITLRFLRCVEHKGTSSISEGTFLLPAYTGLGNFIMMTPMIRSLRSLFPSSKIYVLAGNAFGTEFVLDGTGLAEEILILREEASWLVKLRFFWKLRSKKIDVAFVPFDASPAFYRWGILVAGISRRIGHSIEVLHVPMAWTRDAMTDLVPLRIGRHESDLHFDLLEVLSPGVARVYTTVVAQGDGSQALVRFDLVGKSYVVLQVSAANGMRSPKIWPSRGFSELARRLSAEGFEIVLAGDRMEQEVVSRFARESNAPVVNLAGKTSIGEIASIIRHAAALVCHDSGLMHIGNAVGTPLVALYGPTDYLYTRPMASTSMILRKDLPCAPCMAGFAKTEEEAYRDCEFEFQCMKRITVDEVLDAVLEQARRNTKVGSFR
jgi:lipopolysaccharide heptosyltransferase II